MQEFFRRFFTICMALFILSLSLIQCQNALPQTINRQKRSLRNIDYINMCMFRKTRLCDFLREMDNARYDETREDRELSKRGIRQFYSNW